MAISTQRKQIISSKQTFRGDENQIPLHQAADPQHRGASKPLWTTCHSRLCCFMRARDTISIFQLLLPTATVKQLRVQMKVQVAALINYTHTEILLFEPNLPQVSNESYEHHPLIISSVMQITILTSHQVSLQLKYCALRLHSPGCQSCRVPLEEFSITMLCTPHSLLSTAMHQEPKQTLSYPKGSQPLLSLALPPQTGRNCKGRDLRSHRGRLVQLQQHIFRPPKTKHWTSNAVDQLQHWPGN